jgi:hypothetical protein
MSNKFLSKIALFICIFKTILGGNMNPLTAQTQEDSAYWVRRQALITHYQNLPYSKDAFRALAKLKTQTDYSTAFQIIDSLTIAPQGDVFWLFPMTALYLHCYKDLPKTHKEKIKQSFHSYTPLRGDTENHWCLYYTSLLLMSEKEKQWTWFNGKTSKENIKESKEWLKKWAKTTTTIGQGEFDSPLYAMFFIAPMQLLAQFSEDVAMRKLSRKMLHWLIADFFVDYLDGIYSGANSRIYEYDIFTKRKTMMSSLANFLLGDKPLQLPIPHLLLFAFSDFRLSQSLQKMALDRSIPYESKERKRSRDRLRYHAQRQPVVARYTYMSKSFSLGAIQTGKTEEILQHTWQLCWREHKQNEITTLFGLHPYAAAEDLSSLFPSLPKEVIKEVASTKPTYPQSTKWVGASPYEHLFQYKNTLLCLLDSMPSHAVNDNLFSYNLFFPKDLYKEIYLNDWFFFKHEFVFIALRPLGRLTLQEEFSQGERWQMNMGKGGFVLYADEPSHFISFEDFKQQVLTKFDIRHSNSELKVKTLGKDELTFSYAGQRKINGSIENLQKYPLFKNRFFKEY